MKKLLLSLMLGSMVALSSCYKCEDKELCTEEFRRINIFLDNSTQVPVSLDEAYTLRIDKPEKLIFDQSCTDGTYIVLDDSYQASLENNEADFRFIGIKNNQVVVDQTFKIAADKCHIFKKSGPDSVLLP
jgi:hypothetical protein